MLFNFMFINFFSLKSNFKLNFMFSLNSELPKEFSVQVM